MTLLLPTLAVAFAAFCVWLTVRVVNRKERWAKRALAGLVLLAVASYPLSLGPLGWLLERRLIPDELNLPIAIFYSPLYDVRERFETLHAVLRWYEDLWLPPPWERTLPAGF
ncbi:MAG: hypothetical protein HY290_14300 [Planctomycetia bacterium]|nr:hypothetical protein [Planctomycetia bacterium]